MRYLVVLVFSLLIGCSSMPSKAEDAPVTCPERNVKAEVADPGIPSEFSTKWPGTAGQRTLDEIQIVFSRNKGNFSAIYMRAQRSNPCLEGRLQLAIAIAQDGTVVDAQILGSSLANPDFEKRLVQRVLLLQFAKSDKPGYFVMSYPITFAKPS